MRKQGDTHRDVASFILPNTSLSSSIPYRSAKFLDAYRDKKLLAWGVFG